MRCGGHILKKLPPLPIVATSRIPLIREQLQGKDPKEHFQQVEELLQSLGYQAKPMPHHKKKNSRPSPHIILLTTIWPSITRESAPSISPYSNTSSTAKWITKNAWPKPARPAASRLKIHRSTAPNLSRIGILTLKKEIA
jgi:hypothetical protein